MGFNKYSLLCEYYISPIVTVPQLPVSILKSIMIGLFVFQFISGLVLLLSLDLGIVAIGSLIVVISIVLLMVGLGIVHKIKRRKIRYITDISKSTATQELEANPKDYMHPIEKKLQPLSPLNYT